MDYIPGTVEPRIAQLTVTAPRYVTVAVFAPLRTTFDYLYPADCPIPLTIGCRVIVPFGRGPRPGIVVALAQHSAIEPARLKPILEVIDPTPTIGPDLFGLAQWAADYYHHPLGEVFEMMLPGRLRTQRAVTAKAAAHWSLTPAGHQSLTATLGSRQRAVLEYARAADLTPPALAALPFDARRVVRDLTARGWLDQHLSPSTAVLPSLVDHARFLALNPTQQASFEEIKRHAAHYRAFVLHGVTGSGKTEIYLQLIREVIANGGQALVLIPEIGLTEQLVSRFRERFGNRVAVVHSGLSERSRVLAWQQANTQVIQVLLGTRSAVWMPLPALRLIVVDEEHDLSYKQQDGMRYSARDVAVVRAHRAEIPVVLGSATPSLESLANCEKGKYGYLEMQTRAGDASLPTIKTVDIRGLVLRAGVSEPLDRAITACLARGEQALLFLNRRGYAPIALCHQCGWIATCARCDARLVVHKSRARLICHHCGTERRLDAQLPGHPCGAGGDFVHLGLGTEQLEAAIEAAYPGRRIARIDRDTMTTPRQLDAMFAQIRAREVDILIGTQMIAKGHDFAHVTLVGVIDADSRLMANDFRAEEKFAQLVAQVAGRAGRTTQHGVVLIQTHHPHHPIFETLTSHRYLDFARRALAERAAAELPPSHVLAMVRAEATDRARPLEFLREIAAVLRTRIPPTVILGGPIPAPMEKRIGKFHANLMLTAPDRSRLTRALSTLVAIIEQSPNAKRVRWQLDIDAQEGI